MFEQNIVNKISQMSFATLPNTLTETDRHAVEYLNVLGLIVGL